MNVYGKSALHVGKVKSLVSRIIENPREKGKIALVTGSTVAGHPLL